MTVPERLRALRAQMKAVGADACLVPTDDFHGSEYVGDYFKCRKYLTGFTGSAGTAVITQESAGLWTDGRYFLQAEAQLAGSGITLYRMGEPGVPTVHAFLQETLQNGQALAFDGRTVSAAEGKRFEKELGTRQIRLITDVDLPGMVWPDRPALSCKSVWLLEDTYTGRSRGDKLAWLRGEMADRKADTFLLSTLDDIAWLLNIRGDDVAYNPVVLSYLMVKPDQAVLYIQKEAVGPEVLAALQADGIVLAPYDQFYADVSALASDSCIWLDPEGSNYALQKALPAQARILYKANPVIHAKAVKNATEMDNIRQAHLEDGVAVTRFIYWLKTRVGKEQITEISAAEKLEQLRQAGRHYLGQSFDPIIAYGEHASVIHYSPVPETDVPLQPKGMVLADTGGQYLEGTTDITRTIVLGPISDEEKEMFTRVLRGHLNLAGAVFKDGSCGVTLDYLARQPLWEIGLDYRHGTGHGVGYCLNVHEGPNSFHWRPTPGRKAETVFEEGMLTSDEPGYYKDHAYGIRHENLLLTVKGEQTEYGQFMAFETVTLVPFDKDGIDPALLSLAEKGLLNAYHARVYEKLSPYFEGEELCWLQEATAPLA